MDIREYIFKNRITQKDFAKILGISAKTLWTIVHGADVKMSLARKIVRITKGQVTYEEIAKEIPEDQG